MSAASRRRLCLPSKLIEVSHEATHTPYGVRPWLQRLQRLQAKIDVGRELSPAWQQAYRVRFDSVAEKLLAIEADLRELAEFEDAGRKQGVDICRFGRTALQHLSGLGLLGCLSESGWTKAIRVQHKCLGDAA